MQVTQTQKYHRRCIRLEDTKEMYQTKQTSVLGNQDLKDLGLGATI